MQRTTDDRASRRARLRNALAPLTGVALVCGWVAPDGGVGQAVGLVIVAAWLATVGAFAATWIGDRRRGDRSAVLDARLVLGVCAAVAIGAAALVEHLTGSTTAGTVVCLVLLVPALAAYVAVART